MDVVKSLLGAGGNVDARDKYGLTALHKVGHSRYLVKKEKIETLLSNPRLGVLTYPPSFWKYVSQICGNFPYGRFQH